MLLIKTFPEIYDQVRIEDVAMEVVAIDHGNETFTLRPVGDETQENYRTFPWSTDLEMTRGSQVRKLGSSPAGPVVRIIVVAPRGFEERAREFWNEDNDAT